MTTMKRKTALALAPLLLLGMGSAAMAVRDPGDLAHARLEPMGAAGSVGLQDASGFAILREDHGSLRISLQLGGADLPPGSVLEGWVVDAGLLGGPGTTNASDADQVYGTPFGNADFAMMVENSPYALSTGVLDRRFGNRYGVSFHIDNNLSPYDAVVITLESDGNAEGYDPRPGAIVLAGPIMR